LEIGEPFYGCTFLGEIGDMELADVGKRCPRRIGPKAVGWTKQTRATPKGTPTFIRIIIIHGSSSPRSNCWQTTTIVLNSRRPRKKRKVASHMQVARLWDEEFKPPELRALFGNTFMLGGLG
jgi:hypothetical protein